MIEAFAIARYNQGVQESEVLPIVLQAWYCLEYFKSLMTMCNIFVLAG